MDYWIVAGIIILVVLWLLRSFSSKSETEGSSQETIATARQQRVVSNVDSVDDPATTTRATAEHERDDIVSIIERLDDPVTITRSFRAVFTVMTEERREAIVAHYMRKHVCTSWEAMEFAILDRQNDEERFR